MTKTKKSCAIFFLIRELLGAFLGAFDKYVEILCCFWELFQRFGSIQKLFGAFLTNFETSTEIMCYFLKSPEFGRSPEIREPATPLVVRLGCLRGVGGLELASGGVGLLRHVDVSGGGWVKNSR